MWINSVVVIGTGSGCLDVDGIHVLRVLGDEYMTRKTAVVERGTRGKSAMYRRTGVYGRMCRLLLDGRKWWMRKIRGYRNVG